MCQRNQSPPTIFGRSLIRVVVSYQFTLAGSDAAKIPHGACCPRLGHQYAPRVSPSFPILEKVVQRLEPSSNSRQIGDERVKIPQCIIYRCVTQLPGELTEPRVVQYAESGRRVTDEPRVSFERDSGRYSGSDTQTYISGLF